MVNESTTGRSQYFAAIAASLGAMAVGAAISWSSPYGPRFINELEITDGQVSWIGSTLTFGAGSMCLITGYLTNFIGRRTAMLLLVIPFTFGWMSIIYAKSISMLIIGRSLLGVASGGVCVIAPMYIGEIAQNDNRGILCSFFQLLSTAGTLFVYIAGNFMSTSRLSVLCSAIPLIFGISVFFCPESPTYLMQEGKPDEASEALLRLRRTGYDASIELNEIRSSVGQHVVQQQTKPAEQQLSHELDTHQPSKHRGRAHRRLKKSQRDHQQSNQQLQPVVETEHHHGGNVRLLPHQQPNERVGVNQLTAEARSQPVEVPPKSLVGDQNTDSQKPQQVVSTQQQSQEVVFADERARAVGKWNQAMERFRRDQQPKQRPGEHRQLQPSVETQPEQVVESHEQSNQETGGYQRATQEIEDHHQQIPVTTSQLMNQEVNEFDSVNDYEQLNQARPKSKEVKTSKIQPSETESKQRAKKDFKYFTAAMFRRSSLKALSLSYGLFICQQMSGINILIFYTTEIFEIARSRFSPHLSIAIISVIATFVSGMIIDRFGRRILLLSSQFVVTICTFALGYYFYTKQPAWKSVDQLTWLPLSSLCLFVIAFSIGLGPVPWVMLGELFAPDIKGLAGSISTSSNLTLAFIATKTHDSLNKVFGVSGTFWLYTSFSMLGIIFVYFVVPETKGKSLSDIQKMLNVSDPICVRSKSGSKKSMVNERDNFEMKSMGNSNKIRKPFTL